MKDLGNSLWTTRNSDGPLVVHLDHIENHDFKAVVFNLGSQRLLERSCTLFGDVASGYFMGAASGYFMGGVASG